MRTTLDDIELDYCMKKLVARGNIITSRATTDGRFELKNNQMNMMPVNFDRHWALLVIRGKEGYLFNSAKSRSFLQKTREFAGKYGVQRVEEVPTRQQGATTNECGLFTIRNAIRAEEGITGESEAVMSLSSVRQPLMMLMEGREDTEYIEWCRRGLLTGRVSRPPRRPIQRENELEEAMERTEETPPRERPAEESPWSEDELQEIRQQYMQLQQSQHILPGESAVFLNSMPVERLKYYLNLPIVDSPVVGIGKAEEP